MPLVNCPDCAQPVSPQASTCPRCGRDSPGGNAVLEVMRVRRLAAAAVPCRVRIDSVERGNLFPGKSVTTTVRPGTHLVECITNAPIEALARNDLEVQVPAGHRVVVMVTVTWGTGRPKLDVETRPL